MLKTTRLLNPQAIYSLYGNKLSFTNSEILNLSLSRDEPRLSMRVQLFQKPENTPKKWNDNYDAVYLAISFIGVFDLAISNWGFSNIVNCFDVLDFDSKAKIAISTENGVRIDLSCDWIKVEGITQGLIGLP